MVKQKRVSVFGATGSIGASAVDLLKRHGDLFKVEVVTANRKARELAAIAKTLHAKLAVVADATAFYELKNALAGSGIECAAGETALIEAAARPTGLIIMAISGAAGLRSTFAAAQTSATLALANKESFVCAGALLNEAVAKAGGQLLPVDSEHNAVFQLLDKRDRAGLEKITLTASGGPFRDWTADEMHGARPNEALAHPVWKMGDKISIDCATLMNKGLELIEAQHLFKLKPYQLDVLVHPQSIVHALVSFNDGSTLAQLASPDMRVALSYCLGWPQRMESGIKPLDLARVQNLTFEQPDERRFPCLRLARHAMEQGGLAPCFLNAANEMAIEAFLAEQLDFGAIPVLIEATLNKIASVAQAASSLDDVLAADHEGRKIAASLMPHYTRNNKRARAVVG